GTGGVIKQDPHDFDVEELPLYEPCGEGDHLYLWIEKVGLSTDAAVRWLARELGVDARDVGYAGLKDATALTRQHISVPAAAEPRLAALPSGAVRVLSATRHRNKLRTGHLRGNRFRITVREVAPDALERAQAIAAVLRAQGLPNFFGPQRFGRAGDTARIGWALLAGEPNALSAVPPARRRFMRKLALSAAQAELFNAWLALRMRDELLHTVLAGDVMQVCASGGLFVARDPAVEQARLAQREIVPAGPMFGPKMRPATGLAAEREAAVLAEAGLTAGAFANHGKLLPGTRRPALVWLNDLEMALAAGALTLRFTLPPGSYATVLLAEIMKSSGSA
ncbi:MAG: tRNA pseudouridine(13) synthase TruD, partial [Deltaproteobacteria bacterium]|nr:tRNA pseudouridine(13) synthase TruD [Deltaproteobacteria bacterium]